MGMYIANQNKTIEESQIAMEDKEKELQQEKAIQNNSIETNTNNTKAQSITKDDLYGVYIWQKDFNDESGLNLKIALVLNSDGTAEYSASSGYEYESTKGTFSYKEGKILYTREYYNYDSNNNSEFTDTNSKLETFIVIDKNTLQNVYYNEKTMLTKISDDKILELTKATLEKYDKSLPYTSSNIGAMPYILDELGLETRENLDVLVEGNDPSTYVKSNTIYEDFKNKMLKYVTEELFEKDFSHYKNIDGYVGLQNAAAGFEPSTISKIQLISKNGNEYTFKVTYRNEVMYEHFK